MPLLDHFNLIAPLYDCLISSYRGDTLLELMALPVHGILLDAAGGTGRVSQILRPYVDQVIVADLSTGMLRQAKNKDGLRLVCSYTEWLPFPDESYERIVMVDALHHVSNQRLTAAELWRVLKPGGRIVVEEPNLEVFVVKLVALLEKLLLMRSHFLLPEKIAALFSGLGGQPKVIRGGVAVWVVVEKVEN